MLIFFQLYNKTIFNSKYLILHFFLHDSIQNNKDLIFYILLSKKGSNRNRKGPKSVCLLGLVQKDIGSK